jgi:hypothetical protein
MMIRIVTVRELTFKKRFRPSKKQYRWSPSFDDDKKIKLCDQSFANSCFQFLFSQRNWLIQNEFLHAKIDLRNELYQQFMAFGSFVKADLFRIIIILLNVHF